MTVATVQGARLAARLPTVERLDVNVLRRSGASEISATSVRYVFEHRSWMFESLKRQLGESLDGDRRGRDDVETAVRVEGRPRRIQHANGHLR